MATTIAESQPLLGQRDRPSTSRTTAASRGQRTVTFNPLTQIQTQPGASNAGAPLRPAHSPSTTLAGGSIIPAKEPMLSAFNSKLRRRNSHGAPLPTTQPMLAGLQRVGAQRTSRTAEKLKILPNPEYDDEGPDEESGRDVYSQFTRIKDPTARRDAARLGKADRDRLPRVTAYCTAQGYRLDGIMRFAKSRNKTRGANPKLFDECLYSPYDYNKISKRKATEEMLAQSLQRGERSSSKSPVEERLARAMSGRSPRISANERRYSDSQVEVEEHQKDQREHLLDLQNELIPPPAMDDDENAIDDQLMDVKSSSQDDIDLHVHRTDSTDLQDAQQYATGSDFTTEVESPEVFIFDYGTVVIWGMTPAQEQRFLNDISKFATSPLPTESIETEEFNFYYTHSYQARIYNDFISLRDPRNHMIKLAISHALSQSVKTSLFEDLVSETIESTSPLPAVIAQTGSVNLTRRQLNMQIGELFILRINIHLQGSVLDNPELMWAEPHLEPVYAAVRSYLEIGQRVGLLTERLDVISDLLAVLREQGSRRHDEILEWIVIVLIAAEIIVAAINIVVDVWAGEA